MTQLLLPLFGLVVGAAAGWLVHYLAIGALAQSVTAAMVAAVLSSLGAAFIWVRSTAEELSTSAVTVDLTGVTLSLVPVGIGAAALHFTFGWLGRAVFPSILDRRSVVIGSASGLMFGLAFAVAAGQVELQQRDAIDRAASETGRILSDFEQSGQSAPVMAWLLEYHGEAPSHQVILTMARWATHNPGYFERLIAAVDDDQRSELVSRIGFALLDGDIGEEFVRVFETSEHPGVREVIEHYETVALEARRSR